MCGKALPALGSSDNKRREQKHKVTRCSALMSWGGLLSSPDWARWAEPPVEQQEQQDQEGGTALEMASTNTWALELRGASLTQMGLRAQAAASESHFAITLGGHKWATSEASGCCTLTFQGC